MIPFLRHLGACAAALLLATVEPAAADPIGAVGDPSIISTIQDLSSIHEGTAGPELWILFAATCEKSAAMRRTIAASSAKLRVSWVPAPIDGGASDPVTARLVGAGLADMDKAFAGDVSSLPAPGEAAAHQASEIEMGLARRMFQATGRPLATPTIVYRDPDGLIRVVRGAVGADLFARLAADAR